jgi:hypothetical protein
LDKKHLPKLVSHTGASKGDTLLNHFTNIVGLVLIFSIGACSSPPPRTASGKKLKLETITHDWQTTYVYREVDDLPAATSKH